MSSELFTQDVIDFYTLSSAHAGLSAQASMGRLLQFEAVASVAATEQLAAIKARRISKKMIQHLNEVCELAESIAATELAEVCYEVLEARQKTNDFGTLTAQALLFSNALERTRLAAAIIFDLCEIMGTAPNGKPLPPESDPLNDIGQQIETLETENL